MFEPDERPPIATEPVSVVLPAHNAESSLEKAVAAWLACLEGRRQEHEILLVDDGSTDRTVTLAEGVARRHARVRLLRHAERRGFGAALRTGLAAARHPLLCYTLCGSQYQAADLAVLLQSIDKVDLVAGSRVGAARGLLPRLRASGYRSLLRLVFALRLKDPGCLFLVARRSIFARIPLQSSGGFAHAEVLAKANFLGCLMSDAPVTYRPPAGGELPPTRVACKHMWTDAWRVVSHPDFGPAFLPEEAAWCADWARALSPF